MPDTLKLLLLIDILESPKAEGDKKLKELKKMVKDRQKAKVGMREEEAGASAGD